MQTTAAAESGSATVPRPIAADAPALATTAALEPCANCGAAVTGKYCAACGQRHEHATHSLGHFLREATEDLTHADSRFWRTLVPLLVRPGFLTLEFLQGRRVSYLPPVRLYLVLSVLFFLIAAVMPQAATAPQPIATQKGSHVVLTPFGPAGTGATPISAARAKETCADFNYSGPFADRLAPRISANCIKLLTGGGESLKDNFLHNAGRAMFLVLPLLALIMKALYRKPPRHYVEHLLFFVHNHAFLFLALGAYELLAGLLPALPRAVLHTAILIYIPVYFYASMRHVYGQGWVRTGAKLAALCCAYCVLGVITMAGTALYSFLTL